MKRWKLFRKVLPPAYEGTVWTTETFWRFAGWRHRRTTYTKRWFGRTPVVLYILGFTWRKTILTYRTETGEMAQKPTFFYSFDDGRIYHRSKWSPTYADGEDVSSLYGY